jgi:hypothetical protein
MQYIEAARLCTVRGGINLGTPPPQPQERDWIGNLTDNLRQRGYDPGVDPDRRFERSTPNADKDAMVFAPYGKMSTEEDM